MTAAESQAAFFAEAKERLPVGADLAFLREVYADVEQIYLAENADRIAAAVAELEQESSPSGP